MNSVSRRRLEGTKQHAAGLVLVHLDKYPARQSPAIGSLSTSGALRMWSVSDACESALPESRIGLINRETMCGELPFRSSPLGTIG